MKAKQAVWTNVSLYYTEGEKEGKKKKHDRWQSFQINEVSDEYQHWFSQADVPFNLSA